MRFVFQCIGFFSILLYVVTVQAYDIATHAAITMIQRYLRNKYSHRLLDRL
jgi:hypothetical protein